MAHVRSDVTVEVGILQSKIRSRIKVEVNMKYWVGEIKINVWEQVRVQVKTETHYQG